MDIDESLDEKNDGSCLDPEIELQDVGRFSEQGQIRVEALQMPVSKGDSFRRGCGLVQQCESQRMVLATRFLLISYAMITDSMNYGPEESK